MMAARTHALPAGFRRAAQAVAIGASAGGLDALLPMLSALPAGYGPPVIVVLHLPDDRSSLLAEVFSRRTPLPVYEPQDKQPLLPGSLYFAPAGYHLLLEAERTFSLSCDAAEHYSRPSIDVLFESAADALGEGLVAILLTGANEDGAAGMARAGEAGAFTVVQDPDEARWPDMPAAALALREPDFVLPLAGIQTLLTSLEYRPCQPTSPPSS